MGGGGGQRGVSGERGGQTGVGGEGELGVREREGGLSAAIRYCKSNKFMKLNQNIVKENLNSAFSRSQKYPRFQMSSKLSAGTVLCVT